jgi:hypothetical protein
VVRERQRESMQSVEEMRRDLRDIRDAGKLDSN